MTHQPTLEQQNICKLVTTGENLLIEALAGTGKCLGIDTPITMYDGTIKRVQDIIVGDLLLGIDGTARTVLSTNTGQEALYRIVPVKGNSFICNESHILSTKASFASQVRTVLGKRVKHGDVVNLSVKKYLQQSLSNLKDLKLYSPQEAMSFADRALEVFEPYLIGLWLGDGTTDCSTITNPDEEIHEELKHVAARQLWFYKTRYEESLKCTQIMLGSDGNKGTENKFNTVLRNLQLLGNKHIPYAYKFSSVEDRLQLVAGLLDSDGSLSCGGYEWTTCLENMATEFAFVLRSLGFKVVISTKKVKAYPDNTYYRLYITGNDLTVIPCRVKRKQATIRRQVKNPNITGFKVEALGIGDYYGFTLDGDKLFLLDDFIVTHNTTTGKFIANAVPNKTCLSIFFNKKNAEEGMAQADRPSNMFYSTIHSLCYKQIMNEGFKSKLNNFLLFEDIDTSLLKKLLLNEEAYPKGEYQKELGKLQRIVLDCIKWWQQSDETDVFDFVVSLHPTNLGFKRDFSTTTSIEELDLVVITSEEEEDFRRECIAGTCELLWKDMINARHKAKITHDTYVKMFQLQGLTFDRVYDASNKTYLSIDLLILDEVQDSNAVTLAIFNNQTHLQRIACGDKNQNLYAWRGARNDFTSFASWNKASLTESFRFHQGIADIANKVLALPVRDTKLRLVGRGTDEGTGQTTILCRTNAAVLQLVFSLLLQEKKVACVSKFAEMESLMYHIFAVLNDQKPKFPASALKSFDTKEKMRQTIESNEELKNVYKLAMLISETKGGLYTGLKYLKENLARPEDADYVVSTIHASKGLGFTKVVINEDFLPYRENPEDYFELVEGMKEDNAMTALLYVAISRAMKEVVLPSYLEGVL
jgi:hypothetical protein